MTTNKELALSWFQALVTGNAEAAIAPTISAIS